MMRFVSRAVLMLVAATALGACSSSGTDASEAGACTIGDHVELHVVEPLDGRVLEAWRNRDSALAALGGTIPDGGSLVSMTPEEAGSVGAPVEERGKFNRKVGVFVLLGGDVTSLEGGRAEIDGGQIILEFSGRTEGEVRDVTKTVADIGERNGRAAAMAIVADGHAIAVLHIDHQQYPSGLPGDSMLISSPQSMRDVGATLRLLCRE